MKAETITKCFRSGGVLDAELGVSSVSEEDPFASIDELITQMGTNSCSANEYINGDNTLPVCIEFDDDTWNESFLESLCATVEDEEADGEEEDLDLQPPPPKLRSYREAIQSLDDVKTFLESRSCFTAALHTSSLVDEVACIHSAGAQQTTLLGYFTPV